MINGLSTIIDVELPFDVKIINYRCQLRYKLCCKKHLYTSIYKLTRHFISSIVSRVGFRRETQAMDKCQLNSTLALLTFGPVIECSLCTRVVPHLISYHRFTEDV